MAVSDAQAIMAMAAAITEERERVRREEVAPLQARNERLVALLGKAQVTLIGAEYLLGRHGQSIDGWRELEPAIRAALHEEER